MNAPATFPATFPAKPYVPSKTTTLINTADWSDAISCGYDAPTDEGHETPLKVSMSIRERDVFLNGRQLYVTLNGEDGEVSLNSEAAVEQVMFALQAALGAFRGGARKAVA